MWKRKPAPPASKMLITSTDLLKLDKGITEYLTFLDQLTNLEEIEKGSLKLRGKAIVGETASKALEQWTFPN
jgi:hypothetical protein